MAKSTTSKARTQPGVVPASIAQAAKEIIKGNNAAQDKATALDKMLNVELLNQALTSTVEADTKWGSWAAVFVLNGGNSSMLPELQEKHEVKTALQRAIANNILSMDELKIYLTEKSEAAKQDQTFRDARKGFNNRVARMIAYARAAIVKAETPVEKALSPTGAGTAAAKGQGAGAPKASLYERIARDNKKFVEAIQKKDALTTTDKALIKALQALVKLADSVSDVKAAAK